MASNYSDRLKLELMETGANANTWGTNTNNNLEVVDTFGAGYLSKDVAGSANVTLTTANASATSEVSNKVIEFTGDICRAPAAALANSTLKVITSGTAGTGGTDAFSDTFGSSRSTETANIGLDVAPTTVDASSVSLGATTLSTPTIAAHTHPTTDTPKNSGNYPNGNSYFASPPSNPTGAVGGGDSHAHPMASASGSVSGTENTPTSFSVPTMDIKFANAIVCSKD